MKITTILTSYNRPTLVRQSLKSIADQDHSDYQLLVIDDSDCFDIRAAVEEFSFTEVKVVHFSVNAKDRFTQNRLAKNVNVGLHLAKGDLVTFLCDDDYYYPGWYSAASRYMEENSEVQAAFGKLSYVYSHKMNYPYEKGIVRWYKDVVEKPFYKIDHSQVVHRNFNAKYLWTESETVRAMDAPDAYYWHEISQYHKFHPIDAWASVKRVHSKNLQSVLNDHRQGLIEDGPRE